MFIQILVKKHIIFAKKVYILAKKIKKPIEMSKIMVYNYIGYLI